MPKVNLLVSVNNSDYEHLMLIDVGNRAPDMCDYDFIERVCPDIKIKDINLSVFTANGFEIKILGEVDRPLQVNIYGSNHYFCIKPLVVKNLSNPIILSADTIGKEDIVPHLSKGMAYVKGNRAPMYPDYGKSESSSNGIKMVEKEPNSEDGSMDDRRLSDEKCNLNLVNDKEPMHKGQMDTTIFEKTEIFKVNNSKSMKEIMKLMCEKAKVNEKLTCQLFNDGRKKEINDLFNHQISNNELLNVKQKDLLTFMLHIFYDNISKSQYDMGLTDKITFSIDTNDVKPIRQPLRPMNPDVKKAWIETSNEWEENGIIEQGLCSWSTPLVPVKKKNGTWRFACDYRKVNNVSKMDNWPIATNMELLSHSKFRESEMFIKLDLRGAYLSIPCDKDTQKKLAIITPTGCYKMLRMPFGHSNSAQCFAKFMDLIFSDMWKANSLISFFDDHLIPGSNVWDLLDCFYDFLLRIRDAKIKIAPDKCELFVNKTTFLGHDIFKNCVMPSEKLTEKISNWPQPTNVKEVQSFLGCCNYYRKFIKDFAKIALPLTNLTKDNVDFEWTENSEKSFRELKQKLCSEPILSTPDFSSEEPFIIDADASGSCVGGVLSQKQNGKERAIGYFSKTLSGAPIQYSVTRKELLAIIMTLQHFRYFLLGRKFLVRTDHGSLVWLKNSKSTRNQLFRWSESLNEFNFDIVYRSGKKMGHADGLSRIQTPVEEEVDFTEEDIKMYHELGIKLPGNVKQVAAMETRKKKQIREQEEKEAMVNDGNFQQINLSINPGDEYVVKNALLEEDIMEAIEMDDGISKLIENLENGDQSNWEDEDLKPYKRCYKNLKVENGKLYCKKKDGIKIVVPKSLRRTLIGLLHNSAMNAHVGIERSILMAKRRFYWPNMTKDIAEEIKNCVICVQAKQKKMQKNTELGQLPLTSERLSQWFIDIVGPFPSKGPRSPKYLLTMIDNQTKWPEAVCLKSIETEEICEAIMDNLVTRYGVGLTMVSDRGTQFTSRKFSEMCKKLQIVKWETSAYNPQANMVERMHQTLVKNIRALIFMENAEHGNWFKYVPYALASIRHSPTSTTGYSPFEFCFGKEPRNLAEIYFENWLCKSEDEGPITTLADRFSFLGKIMMEAQRSKHGYNKMKYDEQVKKEDLKIGDMVLVFNGNTGTTSRKLANYYKGPYKITKIINDWLVEIDTNSGRVNVNRRRVKRVKKDDLSKLTIPKSVNWKIEYDEDVNEEENQEEEDEDDDKEDDGEDDNENDEFLEAMDLNIFEEQNMEGDEFHVDVISREEERKEENLSTTSKKSNEFDEFLFGSIEEEETGVFKILSKDVKHIPKQAYKNDAGFDLFVLFEDKKKMFNMKPGEAKLFRTGIGVKIPNGFYGLLKERSSFAKNGGMVIGGIIDQGYEGEIKVVLVNPTSKIIEVKSEVSPVQIIFNKKFNGKSYVLNDNGSMLLISPQECRGDKGFGSST